MLGTWTLLSVAKQNRFGRVQTVLRMSGHTGKQWRNRSVNNGKCNKSFKIWNYFCLPLCHKHLQSFKFIEFSISIFLFSGINNFQTSFTGLHSKNFEFSAFMILLYFCLNKQVIMFLIRKQS